MNVVLSHLSLAAHTLHGTPLSPSHYRHSDILDDTRGGTRTGGELFDTFVHSIVRGAGWSTGSRITHALPFSVVVALAIAAGVFFMVRRRGR